MQLTLEGLSKRFADTVALDDVDLDVASGELIALLGPSGSGKTTLLRAIAGLLPIDAGRVLFGDLDATSLSLRERRVGFVFQHYALFKHLTVAENIAFGPESQSRGERPSKAEIASRVEALLVRMQLAGFGSRYPEQLSGGQRQRVALARALAIQPRLLLLDEPFGALDAKVRVELRRWLRQVHDDTGHTTLFVTHDQEEALELADRVVVFNAGRIEQVGTPDEVYRRPQSRFVFDFIGRGGRIDGELVPEGFRVPGIDAVLPVPRRIGGALGPAGLHLRPYELRVVGGEAGEAGLPAEVRGLRRIGARNTLELSVAGQGGLIEVDLDSAQQPLPQRGERVRVTPVGGVAFTT
ncbi:MAG: sulfate/molybdate ABC transporter ATP-binding protein [Silanimonas sp.]